jgi:glycine cleavage system aminomethyltransferase T
MDGPAPEEGSIIRTGDDYAGYVTSSRYSPILGHTVMLGWVRIVDDVTVGDLTIGGRRCAEAATPFFDPEGTRARA